MVKILAKLPEKIPDQQVFEDIDISSPSEPSIRDEVLKILQKPSNVDTKALVQRATYGVIDPFDSFDFAAFKSKIKN